ncbi:MAG: ribonuclease D [Coriobacteriia bacterium]|nr:ribonuclease D [Coriobacteriia bacterium]
MKSDTGHNAVITTDAALADAIQQMRTHSVIAVDTEFIREKTYYAQLCLIQIAYGDTVVLVDPLADIDLSALREVFCDLDILKIFHSGQQDLEILYQALGEPVRPIFDTQCASAIMGMTDQISYGSFIKNMLDVELAKIGSFSQWAKRPLTDQQLEYAKDDVSYLLKAYPVARKKLKKLGRLKWLDEEFAHRESVDFVKDTEPELAFRYVKRISTLSPRQAAVAREVAAWRQLEAIRLDRPRRHILPDETIIEISRKQPRSVEGLENIRGLNTHARRHAQQILAAVRAGKRVPDDELPVTKIAEKPTTHIDPSVKLANALVARRAKEYQIAPNVLASTAMLEELIRNPNSSAQLLQGWRKKMIGQELLDLLNGTIALFLCEGKVQTVCIDEDA